MASAPPLRPSCLAILPAVVLIAACSASGAGKPASTAPPAPVPENVAVDPAAEAAPQAAAPAPTPEPERDWITDAEGKRYYLDEYPKKYAYRRVDDKHVRTVWGPVIEVDREDDESFYYRVYESDPTLSGPSLKPKPPSEEVIASYRVEVPEESRLGFAPFAEGLPQAGQWRNGFAIADVDGDGHLDIAHGAPRKGGRGPVVFLGDSAGHWRRWQAQFPPFPYDYGDAAAGDLDGDGRIDLVFGIHLKGLVALVQQQPGRFALWNEGLPWSTQEKGPGFSSRAIELVDWNQDGRLDILALGEGPTMQVSRDEATPGAPAMGVRVFLNQGGGKWTSESVVEPATGLFGDQIILSDIDGDGHQDALVSSNAMNISEIVVRGAKGAEPRSLSLAPFRGRTYARSVASGDFDGDGIPDIAVGFMSHELLEWRSGVDLYLQREGGEFERRLVYVESGNRGIWALDSGDLDADGRLDLVGATGNGELIVLLGRGDGGFVRNPGPPLEPAQGCRGYHVRVVDLDGDGRAEVVAEFAGERSGLLGVIESGGCAGEGSLRAWRSTPAAAVTGAS